MRCQEDIRVDCHSWIQHGLNVVGMRLSLIAAIHRHLFHSVYYDLPLPLTNQQMRSGHDVQYLINLSYPYMSIPTMHVAHRSYQLNLLAITVERHAPCLDRLQAHVMSCIQPL